MTYPDEGRLDQDSTSDGPLLASLAVLIAVTLLVAAAIAAVYIVFVWQPEPAREVAAPTAVRATSWSSVLV
jgi:hypothetical protein